MARPARIRLLEEREVPARIEDMEASAPAPARENGGEAVIAALRAEIAQRESQLSEARQEAVDAAAIADGAHARAEGAEAARQRAVQEKAEIERHAASDMKQIQEKYRLSVAEVARANALAERLAARERNNMAVALAVLFGLCRHLVAALWRTVPWFPALGAIGGGFWLFARVTSSNPTLPMLGALALYGGVIVAPAAVLALKSGDS